MTLSIIGSAGADIPHMITYQGRLTQDDGSPLNESVSLSFAIYADASGVSQLWTEEYSKMPVVDGLFTVILGSTTAIDATVFDGATRYLGIAVNGVAAGDLVPMMSVAHSYRSVYADTAAYALDAPTGSGGPWSQSYHRVYLSDIETNVAIGYLGTPEAKLHVGGDIKLEDGGDVIFGTGTTRIKTTATVGQQDMYLESQDDIYLSPIDRIYFKDYGEDSWGVVDPEEKMVGLGTTTPEEVLHVANDASGGRAFIKVQTTHPSNWHETGIRIETPQNRWHWRMDDDMNNQMPHGALGLRSQNSNVEAMTWDEDGNVGINAPHPQQRLQVGGSAFIDGWLGVGVESPVEALDVIGNATISGDVHIDDNLEVKGTVVAGSISGNYAANSINRNDIVDEVGVASATAEGLFGALEGVWQPMLTREITVPAAGYVLGLATARLLADHENTDRTSASISIADAPDDHGSSLISRWFLGSGTDDDILVNTITTQQLFHCPAAGTYTYYLLFMKGTPSNVDAYDRILNLLYIPTAYASKGIDAAPAPRGGNNVALSAEAMDLARRANAEDGQKTDIAALMDRIEALEERLAEVEGKR